MERRIFPAGGIIFDEGDPGDCAYLLESGEIEVSTKAPKGRTVLGGIKPGALFGEMALITRQPRMARAAAKTDCACWIIPPVALEKELGKASPFLRALVGNLIGHLRSMNQKYGDQVEKSKDRVQVIHPDAAGTFDHMLKKR